jgi:glycine cleavage system transcriptional repressor
VAHFAVSAVGRDRPGIAAALTGVLLDLDGNVEDSRMTILRGQFAVMLIVSFDEPNREALALGLNEVREAFELKAVVVAPFAEPSEQSVDARATHVITVHGTDDPGIVHSITAGLAERGVNIIDLHTKIGGNEAAPVFEMVIDVDLGHSAVDDLEAALTAATGEFSVDVSLGETGTPAS